MRAAVLAGLLIGVLGGLIGLILGSLRLPALSAPRARCRALLGARLTGRLSTRRLLLTVGAILLVAGTAAILQGAL
ncbi:MAG TPA: hypothetical protein VGK79_10185 [Gaiellaceae bacterium]